MEVGGSNGTEKDQLETHADYKTSTTTTTQQQRKKDSDWTGKWRGNNEKAEKTGKNWSLLKCKQLFCYLFTFLTVFSLTVKGSFSSIVCLVFLVFLVLPVSLVFGFAHCPLSLLTSCRLRNGCCSRASRGGWKSGRRMLQWAVKWIAGWQCWTALACTALYCVAHTLCGGYFQNRKNTNTGTSGLQIHTGVLVAQHQSWPTLLHNLSQPTSFNDNLPDHINPQEQPYKNTTTAQ